MLVNGATADYETGDGRTALIHASMVGNEDVILALVQRGANINLETSQARTALIMASIAGDTQARCARRCWGRREGERQRDETSGDCV